MDIYFSRYHWYVVQDQSGEWFELEPPQLWTYGRLSTENSAGDNDDPEGAEFGYHLFTTKLVNEVKKQGGMPIFYSTWQSRTSMCVVFVCCQSTLDTPRLRRATVYSSFFLVSNTQ